MKRAALLALAFAALPQAALACAVCGGGNPANRTTFFLSTIVLSLLPLAMFAAAVLWLRRRLGDRLRDELQDRDGTVSPSAPQAPQTGR
jgi:drug/metabolite transporter (DMT)-like permease